MFLDCSFKPAVKVRSSLSATSRNDNAAFYALVPRMSCERLNGPASQESLSGKASGDPQRLDIRPLLQSSQVSKMLTILRHFLLTAFCFTSALATLSRSPTMEQLYRSPK